MKKFESFLARNLEEFVQYRRDLGYVNRSLGSQLRVFDRYLLEKAQNWEDLKPALFLDFREQIPGGPQTVNNVILAVRNFFDYLHRNGHCASNVVRDLPAKTEHAFVPFIFNQEDIDRLLQAVQNGIRKTKSYFLRDFGIYMAILLQARCGLRISEPLRLLCHQYDPKQGTISIEKTKFHKDRLLPLPQNTQTALDNYLAVRNELVKDNPYLLAGFRKGLRTMQIYKAFHQAVAEIGLQYPRRVIGKTVFGSPTPHSLRHSFAVNTLKAIQSRGKDPQEALPVLAAYMGHTKYRYTAVYLKVLDAEHRQGLVNFAISHQEEM